MYMYSTGLGSYWGLSTDCKILNNGNNDYEALKPKTFKRPFYVKIPKLSRP